MALDFGWIPCSDRLPELVEDYLIHWQSADVLFTDGTRVWFGRYQYTPRDDDWEEDEKHEWTHGDCWYADNVIAWQPLPSLECFSAANSTP